MGVLSEFGEFIGSLFELAKHVPPDKLAVVVLGSVALGGMSGWYARRLFATRRRIDTAPQPKPGPSENPNLLTDTLRRRIQELESALEALRLKVGELGGERDHLRRRIGELETEQDYLRQQIGELETERACQTQQIGQLEAERDRLRQQMQ